MTSPSGVLVIGGGLSASALVTALRARGFAGGITVAGAEPHPPYDRPPLTKDLTRPDPSPLLEQFPGAAHARWLPGLRATSLTPLPDGGARVSFESHPPLGAPAVVIATGASAVLPPGWEGAATISTWDDALRLRASLAPAPHTPAHLGIAGAGWLGVELASSAAAAGHRVTLVGAPHLPLGTVLPPDAAHQVLGWLSEGGVTYRGGHPVTEASRTRIVTEQGEVSCDVVVGAVGARPATDWLPADLLARGGHVAADGTGRTAWGGVWAVGDAASSYRHWNAAVASAERCAADLMGEEPAPVPVPHVFSTIAGRDVDVIGWPRPDLGVVWRGDPDGEAWTALLHGGGKVHAGVVVGRPRDAADLRRLLADGPAGMDLWWAAEAARLRAPGR
ncbi:MAG: FAD/NAD(P)-binding oxidoreductase [bacterium]|nr:FAD/NAD(P)-binding oxidoreductase [bacterium]